jgi:hypothetical protein
VSSRGGGVLHGNRPGRRGTGSQGNIANPPLPRPLGCRDAVLTALRHCAVLRASGRITGGSWCDRRSGSDPSPPGCGHFRTYNQASWQVTHSLWTPTPEDAAARASRAARPRPACGRGQADALGRPTVWPVWLMIHAHAPSRQHPPEVGAVPGCAPWCGRSAAGRPGCAPSWRGSRLRGPLSRGRALRCFHQVRASDPPVLPALSAPRVRCTSHLRHLTRTGPADTSTASRFQKALESMLVPLSTA